GVAVTLRQVIDHVKAKSAVKKFSCRRPRCQAGEKHAFAIENKVFQSMTGKPARHDTCVGNVPEGSRFNMPGLHRVRSIAKLNFIEATKFVTIEPDRYTIVQVRPLFPHKVVDDVAPSGPNLVRRVDDHIAGGNVVTIERP